MSGIPVYQRFGDWHQVHVQPDSPYVTRRQAQTHWKPKGGPYGTVVHGEMRDWLNEYAPNDGYRFKQMDHQGVGVRFRNFNTALLFRIRFSL